MTKILRSLVCCLAFLLSGFCNANSEAEPILFDGIRFKDTDAVLVTKYSDQESKDIYAWQANKPLIPASLTKLVTTWLALDKWGGEHRFKTDFFIEKNTDSTTLWVKGYGDPLLTSEELELLAKALKPLSKGVDRIAVDGSWFDIDNVPGRTQVVDPYNAPLSAVSANFNTVFLQNKNGRLMSAEVQTPLTKTATKVAKGMRQDKERLNLINVDNAQLYFAELLAKKLGLSDLEFIINRQVPANSEKIYTHKSSKTLADNLRAALKYSNNFIANQLFLKLAEGNTRNTSGDIQLMAGSPKFNFTSAQTFASSTLKRSFSWFYFKILEGAGLSHANRFNANQIRDVLEKTSSQRSLLKRIDINNDKAEVFAKTGTLDSVRSYAGFIRISNKDVVDDYTFVFIFNRKVPFKYRDTLLNQLVSDLLR